MSRSRRRFLEQGLAASTLALARPATGRAQSGSGGTVAAMAAALRSLSNSLAPERRAALHFPFAGDERFE